MKKKIYITLGIVALTFIAIFAVKNYVISAPALSIVDYTAYPAFLSMTPVTPNVLLVVDNSGSMWEFAYKDPDKGGSIGDPDTSYDSTRNYYGYFDSNTMYKYNTASGGYFEFDTSKPLDKTNFWNGNFLNWLTMRRVDVVRKVLIGGKATNRASVNPRFLLAAENTDRDFWKKHSTQLYKVYTGAAIRTCSDALCTTGTTYNVKVYQGYEDPVGVIQATADKMRFGLMFFNRGNKYSQEYSPSSSVRDGGFTAVDIGPFTTNLVTQIENTDPSTWTPLAETLYESTRYFEAIASAYNGGTYGGKDPIQYWCQKNFVLILTDGESTEDMNVPGTYWSGGSGAVSDPYGFHVQTYMQKIADNEKYASQYSSPTNSYAGTYYLEGVAYYAHTSDLRTPTVGKSNFEGMQNLEIYTVFAFDESSVAEDILKKTSKYGAFDDMDEDGKPYTDATCGTANPNPKCNEWDRNKDGIPDTYFEARYGQEEQLETKLLEAFAHILNKMASGTAASVLSTTGEGAAAIYQAYFYPVKMIGLDEYRWLGYLQAFFVDEYGNMREDTNGDKKLDGTDRMVRMWFDTTEKRVMVDRFTDVDGNGILDCVDTDNDERLDSCTQDQRLDTIFFDEIRPIWEAGKSLFLKDPGTRKIYTTINGSSFLSDDFTSANASVLRPYLRAKDSAEATNIINFIRGTDIQGYRSRTFAIDGTTSTWKLGDITHSTPTVVAKPMENYDLLYGDTTYSENREKYLNRRHMVYVGANDGMLHAFNGGFYNNTNREYSGGGYGLGEEIWAFIPRELLPHLKWLTDPNYTHVYYVDLKPKVTDVKIFNDDATHPGGWGTILIGGMRYGGKAISTEIGTFRSTYFALDVTDPESPRLLWTFDTTDSGATDLGLTMSYPSVANIENEWYVIFGSGPTNFDSSSNLTGFQKGKVFVLKISGGSNGVISSWTANSNYWKKPTATASTQAFMANPITVDVDTNNNFDALYIGENYTVSNTRQATMWRLNTKGNVNPDSWALSALYNVTSASDISKRITATPSAAVDVNRDLWIYFGTGQFLGVGDANVTDTGAFYGIKDSCWDGSCATTYSNLLDVTNAVVYWGGGTISGVAGATNWTQLLSAASQGWAVYFNNMPAETTDFLGNIVRHRGERVTSKPAIIGGLLMFSTYIPGVDICTCEGTSNFYAWYYETGTAPEYFVYRREKALKGESATQTVSGVAYLGKGLPTSVGLTVTLEGRLLGFIQSSTGQIQPVQEIDPKAPRSGYVGWKNGGLGGL